MPTSLPIWQIHGEIIDALTTGNRLVLVAPTGSGKTTQVPQMILDAGLLNAECGVRSAEWMTAKKIVVLQPRRVAARTVAARVAWERHCQLGEEVGYQIRFDDHTSLGTRICYVTEGILLRWLQDDRTLAEVGAVLFDEFHERNLLSDAALALVKQLQQISRPDLKIVVMSATIEAEPVAEYLSISLPTPNPCPILISEGQNFPVAVHYLDERDERPASEQAADAVERIVNAGEPGDILVFMPGMGEINATIGAIRAARLHEALALIPLHGELPPEDQDLAFLPHSLRKVVVATNVAETSVTIDGIRHVVDSGLARIARYDAERGIGTLFIEEISRASADQRKGRAGRTAPGTCHRLWTESGHLNRPERNTPEIQRADLAEVVLLLHSMGIRKAAEFDWLDKPDPQAVERAEKLLKTLGALEEQKLDDRGQKAEVGEAVGGRESPIANRQVAGSDLTRIGRQMLRLPMHPRYSRMLVEAANYGCVPAAALCAALVSGRDVLMRLGRDDKHIAEARELFEASQESDFFTLLRAYQFAKKNNFSTDPCRRYGIHAQTARQVHQTFEQILALAEGKGVQGPKSKVQSLETEIQSPESKVRCDQTESGVLAAGLKSDISNLNPSAGDQENRRSPIADPPSALRPPPSDDGLLRCLMAGFIDQLCVRRSQGTLECDLTEGRAGTLLRESVVQNATLFVAATIREVTTRGSENLTLLGLASVVKREWIAELFPQQLTAKVEHVFDRTHKRVAAVRLERFQDLIIHHEHQRDVDPVASGWCLAGAYRKGWFELPLFNHEIKQFIARVNLAAATMPELEFPPLDDPAVTACLARAFAGLTLVKEAQATPLRDSFRRILADGQSAWLDELAPLAIPWPDGRQIKLLYAAPEAGESTDPSGPEAQVKLHECFPLREHPRVCEGKIPVKLWLCAPDGKRLEATGNWLAFKTTSYPKLKSMLQKKYPGVAWI